MTAFILSSAIAFALYQLLASVDWPINSGEIPFRWGTISVNKNVIAAALNMMRAGIVAAILLSVLLIHTFTSPADVISKYEVNVVFGFLFGPLFAIWVNNVVIHDADLSHTQILSAIGLLLLFAIGAVGNEATGVIRRWTQNLSSLKVPGAELSFTAGKERNDRVSATSFANPSASASSGTSATFLTKASPGLSYLSALDQTIQRDSDYLTYIFSPKVGPKKVEPKDNSSTGTNKSAGDKSPSADQAESKSTENKGVPFEELDKAKSFAQASIVPPLSCLSAWYERTGDSHSLEKYLTAYVDAFRQLEALNIEMNAPAGQRAQEAVQPEQAEDRKNQEASRLKEISSDFVRHGLATALDVASFVAPSDLPEACKSWFAIYCSTEGGNNGVKTRECLSAASKQFDPWSGAAKSTPIEGRISSLSNGLAQFITPQAGDTRGLDALPYFAIARASLMAQLGQHEAAASILDDWLRRRNEENQREEKQSAFKANPLLQIKDAWLALRVRSTLVTYVEDWLTDQETAPATVVQTEHLENLRLTRDGFKQRLLKADFFKELDKACQTKCEPVFKRPVECSSEEPNERLKLWRILYTSYITIEYTLIHRALEHPDYQSQFAEATNDEARRLVNYDLSCGKNDPKPEVVYAQSLLAFAENAVGYSRVRARLDSEDTQKKRLDEAERAANFGLEIVSTAAKQDQERSRDRYLNRIAGSFAVQVQENLKTQLKKIEQAKKDLAE